MVARHLLALVFLLAGLAKLASVDAVPELLVDALRALGNPGLGPVVLLVVGLGELFIAFALWSGRRERLVAHVALAVVAVFCLYHLVAIVAGHGDRACGCFGDRLRATNAIVGMVSAGMLVLALMTVHTSTGESESCPT